jgi:hypothetical protein
MPAGCCMMTRRRSIRLASRCTSSKCRSYAGLLVSLHQLALSYLVSRNRTLTRPEQFELNKFQHRQVELQELLRRQLGLRTDIPLHLGLATPGANEAEDRLRRNFRLLTLCDRLSLQLCCGRTLFAMIEDIPPAPGEPPVAIHSDMPDDATARVIPWPFDHPMLLADVEGRRVSGERFKSDDAFRAAYANTPVERVRFRLCPS